jgi:hypothetical protein
VRTRTPASAPLLAAFAVTIPATPALASDNSSAPAGCVSDARYARLAVGQRLSHIHSAAGAVVELSRRSWTRAGERYYERLYAMCTHN